MYRLDKHWKAERFLYDYTAAVPEQQHAEDRARGRDEDLNTEAPPPPACGQEIPE